MATYAIKSAQVANARHIIGGTGAGEWNGYDQHIIVGGIGTRAYRGFVKFNVNWGLISAATLHSATLRLWRDKAHGTGTLSAEIGIRGMAKDWAQTGQGGEFVWSGTTPYNWDNRAAYENHRPQDTKTKALGTPNGNQYVMDSIDITDIVLRWAPPRILNDNGATGSNWANYGIVLFNNTSQDADDRCLEFVSNAGTGAYWPELVLDYDLAVAPNAPVNLWPTGGQEVPGVPILKGWLSDTSPNEELSGVHLRVYFDSAGTNMKWDSGELPASGQAFAKQVGNPNWSAGRHYWWRARTKDSYGLWGPWCALQEFISGTPPPAPTNLQPPNGATAWTAPTFSGVSKDVDGDAITNAQIEVYSDAGVTLHWDSGIVASNGSGSNFSVAYGGSGLTNGVTYYWRARVRNVHGRLSPYSNFQAFTVPDSGSVCYNLFTGKATSLTPTLTATAPATQNAYQYIVYDKFGGTHYDSGTVSASGTAISFSYGGTALSEGNKYEWIVRSRNTGNVWCDWSGRAPFWTNSTPVAVPVYPVSGAVVPIPEIKTNFGDQDVANGLGDQVSELSVYVYSTASVPASQHTITRNDSGLSDISHTTLLGHFIEDFEGDVLWRVEDHAYGTLSVDTGIYDSGGWGGSGSLKIDSPGSVTAGTSILTIYPAGDIYNRRYQWNFTGCDSNEDMLRIAMRRSTATGYTYLRLRLTDGAGNYSEFTLSATTGSFIETAINRSDTPAATSGTLDWSNVVKMDIIASLSSYTGALYFDNLMWTPTAGSAMDRDYPYQWRAQYIDDASASNSTGPMSAFQRITYSHLPAIKSLQVQASDLTSGDIHNPSPTLTWTFSGSNGKSQKAKAIRVTESPGGAQERVIYATGYVSSSAGSIQVPVGLMSHTYTYKFEVTVMDTDGLTNTDSVTYYASWTPPADLSPIMSTADEFTGSVWLSWPMSQLSASAFDRYEIKRQSEGLWETVAVIYDQTVTEYYDWAAPFGINYVYKVTQFENVSGSVPVESIGEDQPYVMLDIDDWMSVTPDHTELAIVFYMKREKHADKAEQEVFTPWGRSRKVISRSGILGAEGSIEVVVPADELEDFKTKMNVLNNLTATTYLKSPFGDVWLVVFEPPQYSYRAGGHADASISYVEVG